MAVYRAGWLLWMGGTILIVLSWVGLVSYQVGWVGAGIALVGVILQLIARRLVAKTASNVAMLTKATLEAKDHGYTLAVSCFEQGGTVFFEGIAFAKMAGKLRLSKVASCPAAQLDDARARQEADAARALFELVTRTSPDIARAAAELIGYVSVISGYGPGSYEICQVTNSDVKWNFRR